MLDTLSALESILTQTIGRGRVATVAEIADVLRQSEIDLESYSPYQVYQRGVTAAREANGIIACMNEESRSGSSTAGSWEELLKEAISSSGVTKTNPVEPQSLSRTGARSGHLKLGSRPGESAVFDGIEFVRVPPGEFRMGSTSRHAWPDEKPVTRVRITRGFWLGKYEVTQAQWLSVMGSNAARSKNCGGNCAVESVSWNDVQEFINRLNGRSGGRRYRLPTEAEWEYAARAGTRTDTYAGDLTRPRGGDPVLHRIAWFVQNSGGRPQPVGGKTPNAWGLHDMLGNMWEWVGDWFWYYPGGRVTDPVGPTSGSERVIRGGSWNYRARHCRSANRGWIPPSDRSHYLGFRLLRK